MRMIKHGCMTAFALLLVAPSGGAQTSTPLTTGTDVVRAMHDRYASTWYSDLSFTEIAEQRSPNGSAKSEKWYEEGILPGRLRIDVGVPATDTVTPHRTVIYANDSLYAKAPGQPLRKMAALNLMLVLGFDIYKQPVERTLAQLKGEGFDMSLVHMDTWEGRPVYVVGAAAGDSTSKQFWVDAERLLFVRLLDPSHSLGPSTEAVFGDYRPLAGGWIAAEVTARDKNVVYLHEIYSDIKANVNLPDSLFDPSTLP